MRLFYTEHIDQPQVFLDPEESKHLAKVLRLEQGAEVLLTNGKGKIAPAIVTSNNKHQAILSINGHIQEEHFPGCKITMAVGITKHNDRFEWFLEKVTEAGVYKIQPIITQRSETRGAIKRSRWEKILLSAMKQSQRTFLPVLEEPLELNAFIRQNPSGMIAWCGSKELPHIGQAWKQNPVNDLNILIGPEGDFTEEEYENALRHGYKGINLGPLRLRTETAGIAACMLIKLGYEAD